MCIRDRNWGIAFGLFYLLFCILTQNIIGILLVVILSGLYTFILDKSSPQYIATSQRVLILNNRGSRIIKELAYQNMYNLRVRVSESGKKKLIFTEEPYHGYLTENAFSFDYLTDLKSLESIQNVFDKNNAYTKANEWFEIIAKEFRLDYEYFDPKSDSPQATIRGKIKDLQVEAYLEGAFPFERFMIRIPCSNPEDNYLAIRQGKMEKVINHLIGDPLLVWGNRNFDKKFNEFTDHEFFARRVLNTKIQEKMLTVNNFQEGIYSFGTPKPSKIIQVSTSKQGKIKDNASVLDLHLLENASPTIKGYLEKGTQRKEHLITPLIYEIDLNTNLPIEVTQVMREGLKATITLAKEIRKYGKG